MVDIVGVVYAPFDNAPRPLFREARRYDAWMTTTRSRFKGMFGWIMFIVLAVMLCAILSNKNSAAYAEIPMSEFVTRLEADKVNLVDVGNDELTGEFREPEIIGGDKIGKFRV